MGPIGGGGGGGPVVVDGTTIAGDGTADDPLAVIPAGLNDQVEVAVGSGLSGTGTTASPLVATGGGGGDTLVLVSDIYSFTEDVPGAIDLFANDEPVGEWELHEFRIPSAELGEPPTVHYPSAAAVTITGRGQITLAEDGTGTFAPSLNVHGAVPLITIMARGPDGRFRYSTLSITVTPVNDPPVARDISGVSISDPIEETLTQVTIDLGAAMSDPDGDAVEITLIDATPVVYATPIDLDGGTLVINEATLLGVITPDVGRVDPIAATYTISDGTLTATADINIIIAEVQNLPMISPVSPHNPSNIHDEERLNFFQTYMQEYGPLWPNIGPPDIAGNLTLVTLPPYSAGQGAFVLSTQEPWLYNRVRTAYLAWEVTQDEAIRDVAIEWCELYMLAVGGDGSWTVGSVNPQDVKYKYAENAELYRRMTAHRDGGNGSLVYMPQAAALYTMTRTSYPAEYDANSAELWTERNTAYALRNHMHQFYNTGGDPAVLTQAAEYVDMILEMSAATGAPLHGHNKHEGSAITTPISSPWMSGILMEDMQQFYRHTRRQDVLEWMYNYGLWVIGEALYLADHTEEPEFAGLEGLRVPAYLAGTGIQFPEGTAADMRHCRDVGVLLSKAIWAGEQLVEDVTALTIARDELLLGALVDDAYWTRTTPLYAWKRSNPPRSHAWQFTHFYALVYDTGAAPPIAPVVLTAGTISGSTQQGQPLTFTPPTFRGTPPPANDWMWQLAGVDIAGTENDLTYVTAAIGATTVHGVLSNEAGSVEYDTNTITVVPAGAPEISVQPTAQAAEEGLTVTFACTFTGDPAPTAVAQLDTGSGFATTATGTLDHNTVGDDVTATWESDPLVALDDGTQFRFLVSNGVGSPVPSDEVGISVISQQPAALTTGAAQSIRVTETAGAAGFLNWTWAGWLYIDTTANNASLMEVEGVASRRALLQLTNGTQQLTIGDSNTGAGAGFGTPPPNDTWLWVTFRGPSAHPGLFTATYRAQGSPTTFTMTRANGIEDSVTPLSFLIGGGDGAGCTVRAQHWRVFNSRFSDQACIDEQFNYDASAGAPVFFAVAQDAGGGVLEVVDATGNNATITVTGATYSADGPLTGSIS